MPRSYQVLPSSCGAVFSDGRAGFTDFFPASGPFGAGWPGRVSASGGRRPFSGGRGAEAGGRWALADGCRSSLAEAAGETAGRVRHASARARQAGRIGRIGRKSGGMAVGRGRFRDGLADMIRHGRFSGKGVSSGGAFFQPGFSCPDAGGRGPCKGTVFPETGREDFFAFFPGFGSPERAGYDNVMNDCYLQFYLYA